ncbi:MAG: hypothetical protein WCB02_17815 [Bradyrhizobium sp.]
MLISSCHLRGQQCQTVADGMFQSFERRVCLGQGGADLDAAWRLEGVAREHNDRNGVADRITKFRQQVETGVVAKRKIKDHEIDMTAGQRMQRFRKAVRRFDVRQCAELARDQCGNLGIIVDVKDERSRALRGNGGLKDFDQAREVDRLIEPFQDIEERRAHILAPAPGIPRDHDDRRLAVVWLSAQLHDQIHAVGVAEPEINEDRGIAGGADAHDRRIRRVGEVDRKPGRTQPSTHGLRHGRVVVAEQEPRRGSVQVDIYFTAGATIPGRQLDEEDGSAAWRVVKADLAAKPFDDLFRDAEAKPGPSLAPRARPIGLCKFPEDARFEFLRNPRTLIAHGNPAQLTQLFHGDNHLAFPWREFDRIRQQVREDLRQAIRVRADFGLTRTGLQPQTNGEFPGKAPIILYRLLHELTQADSGEIEHDAAGLQLFDIQNIVDQANQALDVLMSN